MKLWILYVCLFSNSDFEHEFFDKREIKNKNKKDWNN